MDWLNHIVVLTQENRSFDQLFGHYPGADGIPPGIRLPARHGPPVAPYPIKGAVSCGFGPPHSWDAIHLDYDEGKMDGFVRTGGKIAMGYFPPSEIASYWLWARQGILLDHYFSSVLGPTFPNRLYLISGTSLGIKNDPSLFETLHLGYETLFDQLESRHIPWKYYIGGYTLGLGQHWFAKMLEFCPLLWFPRFLHDPRLHCRLVPYHHFFQDLKAKRLPAVSFLSPGICNSGHPPTSIRSSMASFARIARALQHSSLWSRTLFITNFDEAGGFFDHVAPPLVDTWGPGIRVPCLLLSAHLKPGINHGIYDHTSVLRMIEERFDLPLLGDRTQKMASLAEALS